MKPMPTRRGARYETNTKRINPFGLTVAKIFAKRYRGWMIWVEYAFQKLKAYFGPQKEEMRFLCGKAYFGQQNGKICLLETKAYFIENRLHLKGWVETNCRSHLSHLHTGPTRYSLSSPAFFFLKRGTEERAKAFFFLMLPGGLSVEGGAASTRFRGPGRATASGALAAADGCLGRGGARPRGGGSRAPGRSAGRGALQPW